MNGIANGNLPITGGTLTGPLTISTSATDQINFTNGNKYITWAAGMYFRGNGGNWNARFSTQNAAAAGEILGVYTQNFGTAIFTVYNNKKTEINLGSAQSDGLIIRGEAGSYSAIKHYNGTTTLGYRLAYVASANNYATGTSVGDIVDRVENGRKWHFCHGGQISTMVLDDSRRVAINQSSTNSSYQFYVNGSIGAVSKSFCIDHPTKPDHKLHHGSLEGPEHAVYVRGRVNNGVIHLPEYWNGLVDISTVTVQLTAIGPTSRVVWVKNLRDNKVYTGGGDAFYFIQAERKDIDKLEVEVAD